MAKTDPLDPNVPSGSESPSLGDDRIKALARAVAELLNIDHYMGTDGGADVGYNEDAAGEHRKVTINAPISTPSNASNKLFIYGKNVNGKIELHTLDEDGNELQITSVGTLHITSPDLVGTLVNNTYFTAVNNAGDGTVDLIKADTNDRAELADGAVLAAATQSGDDDRTIADKAYADAAPAAQMSPESYTNDESVTYANGLIEKTGTKSVGANTTAAVSFGTAFPHAIKNIQLTILIDRNIYSDYGMAVVDKSTVSTSGFTIMSGFDFTCEFYWRATGY